MSTIQETADLKRGEAKQRLNRLLNIPEGFSSGSAEQFVDCLIDAVLLEMASIQDEIYKDRKK